jgi:hypothetical protein
MIQIISLLLVYALRPAAEAMKPAAYSGMAGPKTESNRANDSTAN